MGKCKLLCLSVLSIITHRSSVGNLVETLSLFIPESRKRIVKWTGRRVKDYQEYSLIGQDRRKASSVDQLPKTVDVLDYDKETFLGQQYQGNWLEHLVKTGRLCEDEPTFLALVHSLFAQISSSVWVYLNVYLNASSVDFTQDPVPTTNLGPELSIDMLPLITNSSNSSTHHRYSATIQAGQDATKRLASLFRRRKSLSSLRSASTMATFITTDNSSLPQPKRTVMDLFGHTNAAPDNRSRSLSRGSRRGDSHLRPTMLFSAPPVSKEQTVTRPRLLSSPEVLLTTVPKTNNTTPLESIDSDSVHDSSKWEEYRSHIWDISQCYGSDRNIVKYIANTIYNNRIV